MRVCDQQNCFKTLGGGGLALGEVHNSTFCRVIVMIMMNAQFWCQKMIILS